MAHLASDQKFVTFFWKRGNQLVVCVLLGEEDVSNVDFVLTTSEVYQSTGIYQHRTSNNKVLFLLLEINSFC